MEVRKYCGLYSFRYWELLLWKKLITAQFLKRCRDALSIPLFIFWRNCLDKQEVPSARKHALITPIFKGKSKLNAENYRPVALTSHIIKIFERVVQKNHFEEANAFNDSQHGFRRGRSCLSQLLAHHNEVLENLENSGNADVLFTLTLLKPLIKLISMSHC